MQNTVFEYTFMFQMFNKTCNLKQIQDIIEKLVYISPPLFLNPNKDLSLPRERFIAYLHIHTLKYTLQCNHLFFL